MSQQLRLLHKPCIPYKKAFKPQQMETVSLRQHMADGRDLKRTCLVFSGNEGVEGLLQMKERFDNICHALQFDTGEELFSNFEQTLTDNAEACWQNLVADIPDAKKVRRMVFG